MKINFRTISQYLLPLPVILLATVLVTIAVSPLHSLAANSFYPQIIDARIHEPLPDAKNLVAYMTIKNPTAEDIILQFVRSPDFALIEIHKTEIKQGVARMQSQPTLIIPAETAMTLKPGSYHLMLRNPRRQLQVGDTAKMRFIFNGSRQVMTVLPVISPDFSPAGHH